ncbi:MAG: hypothetical protein ACE1ZO_00470, partial [Nitrospirales bacterium]
MSTAKGRERRWRLFSTFPLVIGTYFTREESEDMERLLEREIMDGKEQVRAYAQADFSKENQWFVDYFLEV